MTEIRKNIISVITVCYNAKSNLEKTILSVLNQTYSNIEYIIIDGGSTDGTIDIIKRYDDKITYWQSEPDNGIYDAMNKAVNLITGDWIYFLGADDLIYDCLGEIVPLLTKDTIVYGNVLYRKSNNKYGGKFNSFKLISKNIPHQALFYPASVFEIYKFNLKYKLYADYYLNLQCWKDIKFKFFNPYSKFWQKLEANLNF